MPEPLLFDVFLSHSSKDKSVVRKVAEQLRKDGLRVWFDLRAAAQAQSFKPIPDKTVVPTFDDGVSTHATFVAPL